MKGEKKEVIIEKKKQNGKKANIWTRNLDIRVIRIEY
jgi:hypothetical protein